MDDSATAGHAADLLLIARLWAWAAAVRVLKHLLPLPVLVRVVRTGIRKHRRPDRVRRLRELALGVSPHPFRLPGNCLDRSLALFRLLVASGASPDLVIGMRSDAESGFGGHVWIRLAGEALGEMGDRGGVFAPVLAFDETGRPGELTGHHGSRS